MQNNLTMFFYNALIIYSETGHSDILDVLKLVGMYSDEKERIGHLNKIAELRATINEAYSQHSNQTLEYREHHNQMNERLAEVENFFRNSKWSTDEIVSQEEVLKQKAFGYFEAINKRDSMIFINNYPNIFK